MVIHHTGGLHVSVTNGGANKLKSPFFQVFAHGIRFLAGGRYLIKFCPFVYYWFRIYELPDVLIEAVKFLLNF